MREYAQYAQCTSKFDMTVCLIEKTTESRSAISSTLHSDRGKEILISLNFDADALIRRRRRFLLRYKIQHICQGQLKHYDRKCACAYDRCNLKNKIQNSSNCCRQYLMCTNLTSHNPNSPNSFKFHNRQLPKTERNRAVLLRTPFTTLWSCEIHINLKIDADAPNRRLVHLFSVVQCITSVKVSEGIILGSAHESTTYGM
jgi:hypothetical protein